MIFFEKGKIEKVINFHKKYKKILFVMYLVYFITKKKNKKF